MFKSAAFLKEVTKHQQTISFCGVDAHHQNGIAEHRIRVLSDTARIQSLHAMTHNPKCVEPHLWPHALKHANHMFNLFPREGNEKSPEQLFSKSAVDPNINNVHPFGCPACVAMHEKDSGWKPRAYLGVYLGPSPHHASSVGLILNVATGHISPQLHCTCDDCFETP